MNARLRSIFLTASLITAAFSAVTYTSCSEEKCKPVVCANGSTCVDGSCICPSGYEGARCETVNRDRYMGIWNVVEDGSVSAPAEYTVAVEAGNGITDLVIRNFNNYFSDNVNARVKGDTIYIDPQTIAGQTVQGIGYIADDRFYGKNGRLTLRYHVQTSGGAVDNYGFEPGTGNPSVWNK